MIRVLIILLAAILLFSVSISAATNDPQETQAAQPVSGEGAATIDGARIAYQTQTGILDLQNDDADDPLIGMFYVAYFKKQQGQRENRPITFIYNGGPGSASLWLHMGALGPQRVVAAQRNKTTLAPYQLINNQYSLLNVSDLVFIDAPGTGFSRFSSHADSATERAQQKAQSADSVYNVNGDARAFAQFIVQFLSRYQRWNAPKYLLGESYGTTRSVVLAGALQERNIDVNGIILISPFLNYDNNIDDPELNPGVDQPYYLALPTYAASGWYHHRLPVNDADLPTLLNKSEQFALGPYARALAQGAALPADERQRIAKQLQQFTGVAAEVWLQADLRLSGPQFANNLLNDNAETLGRIDTRYSGPALDGLSDKADYDPGISAIAAAFVAQFNVYLRNALNYQTEEIYQPFSDGDHPWKMTGDDGARAFNVLPNLARAMKMNPAMKVMAIAGVYDLATPYFVASYEMNHLPIPPRLRDNIRFARYETGHMPYLDEATLQQLHADLSAFIRQ